MTPAARERMAGLLGRMDGGGAFSSQRSVPPEDLHIEVRGVGPLEFPVPESQATELCAVARPASFGRGTETLLDRRVRDTWEVPKSRVKIDQRRWNKALGPVLDQLRADLGLPEGNRLRARFHSLLVYARGQFFKPHLDSEKDDSMVGSLVVTLPSTFQGGALLVDHGGKRATYRRLAKNLSCVAFYADCDHEIRPVKSGHRIVLTYDLVLEGDQVDTAPPPVEPADTQALVACLDQHFTTPPAPRWQHDQRPSVPPKRLVYLLDHRYTQRSLGWARLKGDDAVRVAALRDAAARADCEVALALADVHETRECYEPERWESGYGGRRRPWEGWSPGDEDDDDSNGYGPGDYGAGAGAADYEVGELLDWDLALDHWIDAAGTAAEPVGSRVSDDEVCTSTPTRDLEPYESEYEPYMGNYGNTMDRWYRRAAVVVWPRRLTFAVRSEASPAWALDTLLATAGSGSVAEVRELASTLAPFWEDVAPADADQGFVTTLLSAALAVDDPSLASMLLRPFRVDHVGADHAPLLVDLAGQYGGEWASGLLAGWVREPARGSQQGDRRLEWALSLDSLAEALVAQGPAGQAMAATLVREMWAWTAATVERRQAVTPPSTRDRSLAELAPAILGVLVAITVIDTADLAGEAAGYLCDEGSGDVLVPCLVQVLRASDRRRPSPSLIAIFGTLAAHCRRQLEARLEHARVEGDWSIVFTGGCGCEQCRTLGAFLEDSAEHRREWPLAKPGRQHVHRTIDAEELPVRHQTRRSGRPYTLVLTKTEALFERDADERRQAAADLAWLVAEF